MVLLDETPSRWCTERIADPFPLLRTGVRKAGGARRCRSGRISPPRGLVLELGEGTGEAATLTGVGRT